VCDELETKRSCDRVLTFCVQFHFHRYQHYLLTYLLRDATVLVELWLPQIFYERFRDNEFLDWGLQPHAQPSTWRTRVSLLVSHLPRNLSGMGGPTSSYAVAGIALECTQAPSPSNRVLSTRRRDHRRDYQHYKYHYYIGQITTLSPSAVVISALAFTSVIILLL
jgi:hypothetical protein